MIKEFSIKRDGINFRLSPNFTLGEFQCHDGSDKVLIDVNLIDILQKVRTYLGKPIEILSAYRTEEYNKLCNGANESYHIKGQASDIRCNGISLNKLAIVSASFGAKGIGIYKGNGFVHIDTRETLTIFREE